MGSFSINNNTAKGTYNISGSNGAQLGSAAQLSVGAPFTITAGPWNFGGCPANIVQVVVSINSNDFLVKQDNCQNALTTYSLDLGQPWNRSTYTWTPCSGTQTTAAIDLYAGKTAATQTITVHAYYSFGTGTFDESVTFTVQVQQPTCPLTFNPPSGGNVFQFGPFLERTAGTYVYTPVAWNNPSYLNPPRGSIYVFGCASGTLDAWTFQGTVTNGTPSSGYAYCVQLVRILAPPQVTYAKTDYNIHLCIPGGVSSDEDGYLIKVTSPRDGSGNVLWGVDGAEIPISQFPWAFDTDDFTQAPANSGALAVPPANSIRDLNGVLQSFYADNPYRTLDATLKPLDVLIEMNFNWQFVSHIAWHPDGGVPISMGYAKWYLDCNEYNATADLTPTVLNSLQTPGNWDLTKTFQTLGDNSSVPSYFQWFYNQSKYSRNVEPGLWLRRPKKASGGVPNLAPMGTGPMGGAMTVPNFGNAALLPRGTSVNVGGMNSV